METLKEQLKRHEGLKLEPYRCPAGFWSIGFGHKMTNDGIKISPYVADAILDEDIAKATRDYESLGWTHLSPRRKNAVINMIFWHGFHGFLKFKKCITAIERSDWNRVSDEMMDSQSGRSYASRMQELADMMREG